MTKNIFAYFLILIISLALISCASRPKPSGFDLQNEFFDDGDEEKPVYLTDTKPIDSVDVNKLIFDMFRIESDMYPDSIKAYARVYDSLGNFVTNMADPYKKDPSANYFTQLDEVLGKTYKMRQENVPSFHVREFGAGDSIPYNIVLSVDYSGSMTAVLDVIFEGTEIFIELKQSYDQIAINSFNEKFYPKVPLTQDKNKIMQLYRTTRNKGVGLFSGVYNAIDNSIGQFVGTDSTTPRVLVIFTDGDDNYSKQELGDLIQKAKDDKIHIFTVAFGYSKDENLRYLAKYTGGKFYKAYTKDELVAIFRDIYMSLRYYYLITYKPPVYWGQHEAIASLEVPGRSDTLQASGIYDTSDLFPWDDIGKVFQRPILFEYDSARIQPESYTIIDEITDALMSKPSIRLEIQGHTDNQGTIEYNQALSERRADAVMKALIARGIEPRRLRARGFGMSRPIASNETPQGQALNRRTEFVVTAK